MAHGQLLLAYHGCDLSTRDALISGTMHLELSKNTYDWLGDGIYFFEGDWRRALKFATASFDRPKERLTAKPINTPAVVGAVLRVGHWLDMSTQDGIDEFASAYLDLRGSKAYLPSNKKAHDEDADVILRKLDRKVFNHIHTQRENKKVVAYDAVRCPFPQGNPVAPSSSIYRDTHVQIALRNTSCVLGYFQVTEARDAETTLALAIAAT